MKKLTSIMLTIVGLFYGLFLTAAPQAEAKTESTAEAVGLTIPYYEDFSDSAKGWTIIDANTDAISWAYRGWGGWDESAGLAYSFSTNDADDWAFSPALQLEADKQYKLKVFTDFIYREQSLKVFVGTGATIAEQTMEIIDLPVVGSETFVEVLFNVPANGNYNLGFYAYTEAGTYTYLYIDNISVDVAALREAPAVVSNLTPVPGANGAAAMSLTWTNPSVTYAGETLSEISSIEIYKDGAVNPIVLTDNLTPGASVQWNDPEVTAGEHTYKVVAVNAVGAGLGSEISTIVGIDLPKGPASVEAIENSGAVNLTWTNPESLGMQGGWYNNEGLTYRIVRQPGNVVLEASYSGNSYTDQTITALANYTYEITSKSVDGVGGTSVSNVLKIGKSVSLPFVEDFEDVNSFNLWTILNVNDDEYAFERNLIRGFGRPSCIGIEVFFTEPREDDWFISPAFRLETGKLYRLKYDVKTNIYAGETWTVTIGKTNVPAAQTTVLTSFDNVSTGGMFYKDSLTFEAPYTGSFNLGFHLSSGAGDNTYFDNIYVEEVLAQDIAVVSIEGNTAPTVGVATSNKVTIANNGTEVIRNYTVQILDADDNVLAERFNSRGLAIGVEREFDLEWTPTEEGIFPIKARVVSETDAAEGNNQSKLYTLEVQPAQINVFTIGEEGTIQNFVPIHPYNYTFSESVYPASLFEGYMGNINAIAYKVINGVETLNDEALQIYIGETDQPNLSHGWVPATNMQLVVDRRVEIPWGAYDWKLEFDEPYEYKGGNIVILVRNSGANNDLGTFGLTFLSSPAPYGSSRYINSYNKLDPFNPINTDGQFMNALPNTMFYIDSENTGALAGNVFAADGTTPLEGATVSIDELNATAVTDAQGAYTFPYVKTGSYSVTAELQGYFDASNTTEVALDATATANFSLTELPEVNFTGKIVGSDLPTVGIANAEISLIGYEDYTVVTDAEGNFAFNGVYGEKAYTISVEAPYYNDYSSEIAFNSTNVANHEIVLVQDAAQPLKVNASDRVEMARVNWNKSVYDLNLTKNTGLAYSTFGSNGTAVYSVGHRYATDEYAANGIKEGMAINKVRFYANAIATFYINIWQGENNNEVLVYTQQVEPELEAWNEFELEVPYVIDLTKNLIVGIQVSQNAGIAPLTFDEGPTVVNGDVFNAGNGWTTGNSITGGMMTGNWNIEAICGADANATPVVLTAKSAIENPAVVEAVKAANDSVEVTYFVGGASENSEFALQNAVSDLNTKEPIGYNIYRLLNGTETEEASWTQLNTSLLTDTFYVDNTWKPLENDIYRFAVKSVYPNDVLSAATFSNGVDKGKYATVSATVTTNGGSSVGATVSLENNTYIYEAEVAADGSVELDNVYFGYYKLHIAKRGYSDFEVDSILINANTIDLGTFQISEDARTVRNVTVTDYIASAEVAWEAPSNFANSWIHKDNGKFSSGIGMVQGGVMEAGVRFNSEELLDMNLDAGFSISKVRFYPASEGQYVVKVWTGSEGYETEIYSQNAQVTIGQWNEIVLDEPVIIDNTQSYVIGYAVNHPAGGYPIGNDVGPAVEGGDMMRFGGNWYSFKEFSEGYFDVNWNIQAFCTYTNVSETAVVEMAKTVSTEVASKEVPVVPNVNYKEIFASKPAYNTASAEVEEEPFVITYSVYRLAEADLENTTNWTLLTSAPIEEMSFTDTGWDALEDGDYRYAIIAKYHNENYSVAEFSDVIEKGAVSLVNVQLSTNNGLSAEGASVVMNGTGTDENYNFDLLADANGEGQFIEVPKATYDVTIKLAGFEIIYIENYAVDEDYENIDSYELNEVISRPVEVSVTATPNVATIQWKKPGAYVAEAGWMYWDNGESSNSIGSEQPITFSAAQRFTPEDLVNFTSKDLSITKISLYYNSIEDSPSDADFQLRVWVGEDPELIYYQDISGLTENSWNEITLDTPVLLDGTEEVYIGYLCVARAGFPAGVDAGPAVANKGAKIFHEGEWYNLYDISTVNANWSIHAYCEEVEGASTRPMGEEKLNVAESALKSNSELSIVSQKLEAAVSPQEGIQIENDTVRFVTGFKVWRFAEVDETNEDAWTLLTPEAITETTFVDTDWATLEQGIYGYAVKAIYATGVSEAEISNALNTDLTSVDEMESNASTRVYPVPNNGDFTVNVENSASITIRSFNGAIVYQGELMSGINKISLSVPTGIYLVQIENNNLNRTEKIIIR